MLYTWINTAQSRLFCHDNAIGSKRNQCPSGHTFSRCSNLKIVAKHMQKVDQIPGCRGIAAFCQKYQRQLFDRAEAVQVVNE